MPVSVKGAIELRKALRAFAPDLAKGLTAEMGAALKPIVKEARGFLPSNTQILSNWQGTKTRADGRFPQYDYATVRRGIGYKSTPSKRNARGFRTLALLFNKSAAGSIYEKAGRNNSSSVFVKNLDNKYQTPIKGNKPSMRGRVLYRAWQEDQGKTTTAVFRAIQKASDIFQARSKVNE